MNALLRAGYNLVWGPAQASPTTDQATPLENLMARVSSAVSYMWEHKGEMIISALLLSTAASRLKRHDTINPWTPLALSMIPTAWGQDSTFVFINTTVHDTVALRASTDGALMLAYATTDYSGNADELTLHRLRDNYTLGWTRKLGYGVAPLMAAGPNGTTVLTGQMAGRPVVSQWLPDGSLDYAKAFTTSDGTAFYFYDVATNSDGETYLCGMASHGSTFGILAVKLGPDGDFLWGRVSNMTDFESGQTIALNPAGNPVIAGQVVVGGVTNFLLTEWLAAGGGINWTSQLSLPADNKRMAISSSGKIYVTGSVYPPDSGNYAYLGAWGSTGALEWLMRVDGDDNAINYDLFLNGTRILTVGDRYDAVEDNRIILITHWLPDGNVTRVDVLKGDGDYLGYAGTQDPNGDIAFGGRVEASLASFTGVVVARLTPENGMINCTHYRQLTNLTVTNITASLNETSLSAIDFPWSNGTVDDAVDVVPVGITPTLQEECHQNLWVQPMVVSLLPAPVLSTPLVSPGRVVSPSPSGSPSKPVSFSKMWPFTLLGVIPVAAAVSGVLFALRSKKTLPTVSSSSALLP